MLHFSVKYKALECIEYILKEIYHQFPDEFQKYISFKTNEGLTPAMISIINESNGALSLLLKYGAIDLSVMDNKRMTAYELAINYKN